MVNKRCEILVVNKKDNHPFLFSGFRKGKFSVQNKNTITKVPEKELICFDLFVLILYEFKDVFELLKIFDKGIPVIIATENLKILSKMKELNNFFVVNLSGNANVTGNLHECIKQIFKTL